MGLLVCRSFREKRHPLQRLPVHPVKLSVQSTSLLSIISFDQHTTISCRILPYLLTRAFTPLPGRIPENDVPVLAARLPSYLFSRLEKRPAVSHPIPHHRLLILSILLSSPPLQLRIPSFSQNFHDGLRAPRKAACPQGLQVLWRRSQPALPLCAETILHPRRHKMLPDVDGAESHYVDGIWIRDCEFVDATLV